MSKENQSYKLRVLLVPDSIHWVTGTIAKNIARFNPWIEATVASAPVIEKIFAEQPQLMRNFDLVHFTCQYATREWLPRLRDLVPVVTSHHHVSDWELLKQNLDGDAIVVGSPEWADDLRGRGADMTRVFCVPYGVDASLFQPASDERRKVIRTELGFQQEHVVVGFFGKRSSNDDDRKGTDVFTRAVLSLKQKLPDLAVLIIGPGWQALKEELESAGMHCVWIPFVNEVKELAGEYQALDFYWVTARIEGGPVTLLEAMSTEVCCLTTPVGIAREIIRDGENGVLLPFNDADAFATRTFALAADHVERSRLGKNARATILAEMDVAKTSLGFEKVYQHALTNFANRRGILPLSLSSPRNLSTLPKYSDVVPLHGFPEALRRRIAMLEALAWAEHLVLYHPQRGTAAKLIFSQWIRNPWSPLPPRVLLRRFLPASLVARIVSLKNRSRLKTNLVATYPSVKKT